MRQRAVASSPFSRSVDARSFPSASSSGSSMEKSPATHRSRRSCASSTTRSAMSARTFPFNADAEATVLGDALLSADALAHVMQVLRHEDFFKPDHAEVMKAMCEIRARGDLVDPIVLAAELERRDNVQEVHPKLLVADLMSAGGLSGTVVQHAEIVIDLAKRRRGLQLIPELERVLNNGASLLELDSAVDELRSIVSSSNVGPVLGPPLDLRAELNKEPPVVTFLHEPYVPMGRRCWWFGPAESGKSIFALWIACALSREGHRVVYVSQENPRDEELRRIRRLQPDVSTLDVFHDRGIDLARPDHATALISRARNASLVVIDTLTACWTGREDDNAEIAKFDRDVLAPLVSSGETSVVILDHTGHPQRFMKRKGASAGRGASSKGQKADVVLEFEAKREQQFAIRVGKMRAGDGRKPGEAVMEVRDLSDGGLTIERVSGAPTRSDDKVIEIADAMVKAIEEAGSLTTNELREAVRSVGGKDLQSTAMRLLNQETPPRATVAEETVQTGRGKQRAKVWRLAEGGQ